jgi:hypothetical protein
MLSSVIVSDAVCDAVTVPYCFPFSCCAFILSKLCSFLFAELNDLTKIYYFMMLLPCSIKTGKISSTYANTKMILIWTPSGTSLQHHMAKMHVMGLGEQLKG